MMNGLAGINLEAHLHYLHPNRMPWDNCATEQELDFLSRSLVGSPGQEEKTIAYLYKELAQLAELEMHVSSVLVRVMAEIQSYPDGRLSSGETLYHALSCFAAEEIHHANTFYQYVRRLSGRDVKLLNNLFRERMELFQGDESPLVKLAALCATAYVGESIITVFERRMKTLDVDRRFFFTNLLHYHGLDEARHIRSDHFVFDHVVPSLTQSELRRMHQIIEDTENLNTQLALGAAKQFKEEFNVDFAEENHSARVQLMLTQEFRRIVQGGDLIKKVDDGLNSSIQTLLCDFSRAPTVHSTMSI